MGNFFIKKNDNLKVLVGWHIITFFPKIARSLMKKIEKSAYSFNMMMTPNDIAYLIPLAIN